MFAEKYNKVVQTIVNDCNLSQEEKGEKIIEYVNAIHDVSDILTSITDFQCDGNPDNISKNELVAEMDNAIKKADICDKLTISYIGVPFYKIKEGDYLDLIRKCLEATEELIENYYKNHVETLDD